MNLDWNVLAEAPALAGGLLIGLAAAMLLLLNGRIAGVSGIAGGLLHARRGDLAWRVAFVAGLMAAPLLASVVMPLAPVQIDAGTGRLLAAGLITGVGARCGGGCTSGHGVCGLARRSPRSFVATLMFIASGAATVYVLRHLVGA
jgi:uncharacterized membrane protein YedE/YeeE